MTSKKDYSKLTRAAGVVVFNIFPVLLCTLARAQNDSWTTKAPLPRPRAGIEVAVTGGMLYAIGGTYGGVLPTDAVTAYDPKTDTWATKAPIPTSREGGAVGVVHGIIYVAGGHFQDAYGARILDSVEAFDPKSNHWSSRARMPTPRSGGRGAVLNGLLYVVGGRSPGVGVVDTVQAYDPETDSWMPKAPLPMPCLARTVVAAGGMLYAFGGFCHDRGDVVSLVAAYDPKTNTWTMKSPMPTARAGTAGVIGNAIYVVGGFILGGTHVGTVEVYDSATDTWSTATPMPTARSCGVGVVDDVLYAVGGVGAERTIFSRNEAFSPFLAVAIDIKPGDGRNTINLKSAGTVPVAILGSATFDPLTVDPATVTLAGAPVATRGRGVPMTSQDDVNHDGYPDLLLHFRTRELQLTPASTEAVLYGETYSGQRIRGADAVRMIR